MTPIQIDEKDYLRQNKALSNLLIALHDSKEPVTTRQLLQTLNSTHHGQTTIKLAEQRGYIKRVRSKTTEKTVGQPPVLNSLTEEGRRLAKIAKAVKALEDSGFKTM